MMILFGLIFADAAMGVHSLYSRSVKEVIY